MLAQSTLHLRPPEGYGQAARVLRGKVDPSLSPDAKPAPVLDDVPVRELADVTRGLALSDATAEQVQSIADSGRPAFSLGQAIRAVLEAEAAPKGLTLEATRRAARWARKKRDEAPKAARLVTGTVAALDLRKAGMRMLTYDDLGEPVVGPPPTKNRATHPFVGTVRLHGLPLIRLENLKGSTRSGTDKDGNAWAVTMPAHYGEFARSEGADGDPVDVFVGPQRHAPKAYVIHLQDPETGEHDEDKVFVAFATADDARACFAAAYNRSDLKMGPARTLSTSELAEWLVDRENRGQKIEAGRLLAKSADATAPTCGCGTKMNACRCKRTATHDGWSCPGCGAHGGDEARKRTPADLRGDVEKSAAPTSQTYGTPANVQKPKAAEPPPAPPPVARPHHHADALQLPTKPTKKFPPPSHRKPTKAPRTLMSTPPEMTKAQRHEADALLKAAGVEASEPKPKRKAAPKSDPDSLAKNHERMQKLHTKASDEAADRGDGALSKLHADAAEAHTAAAHANGAGLPESEGLTKKAADATRATLPKDPEKPAASAAPAPKPTTGGKGTATATAAPAQASGVGGRSKEGLKVIAIGPKGGKIVGYTTKDGKQKAIYEGSQAASKLAATVATHAPEPKMPEAAPEAGASEAKPTDAAAPAAPAAEAGADAGAAATDEKSPAGKGGDYHRAKQAEHAKAAATASKAGDSAGADKHLKAADEHWRASLQNDRGVKGIDAAGASESADEASAKAGPGKADDAAAGDTPPPTDDAAGAQGSTPPAPDAPSEPVDDKPLTPDEPAGGTPSDAPSPDDLGSASPKTDSPETRHAEQIAKMRAQVEDAHKKLAALAHHIDNNLVPMFNSLKGQARATHKNPNPSAVIWLLSQIGRFVTFVLGLHEDKGKVTSATEAMNEKQGATGTDGREFDMNADGSFTETKDSKARTDAKKQEQAKPKLPQTRVIEKSLDARPLAKSIGDDLEGACVGVLVTLQAVERHHHAAHLQAKGPESYSDHLLFQRIYTDIQHEIDGLSEKMVAAFGEGTVDADARAADAAETLNAWMSLGGSPPAIGLAAELELQDAIASALEQAPSVGLENLLQGIADRHETWVYLLQQRLSPAVEKSMRVTTSRQASAAADLLKSAIALG